MKNFTFLLFLVLFCFCSCGAREGEYEEDWTSDSDVTLADSDSVLNAIYAERDSISAPSRVNVNVNDEIHVRITLDSLLMEECVKRFPNSETFFHKERAAWQRHCNTLLDLNRDLYDTVDTIPLNEQGEPEESLRDPWLYTYDSFDKLNLIIAHMEYYKRILALNGVIGILTEDEQ